MAVGEQASPSAAGDSSTASTRFAYFALGCAGAIGALAFGLRMSFGIFLSAIADEVSEGSREMFSMATAIQSLIWGFSTPLIGSVTDRSGPLVGIWLGALLFAAGLFCTGMSSSAPAFFISTGVAVGVACGATSFGVLFGAVGKLFPDSARRTRALGITTSLASLGQFSIPPIAQWLNDAYGWRTSFKTLALLALAIIPLAVPLARAERSERVRQNAAETRTLHQTLRDASRYHSYQLLVVGFFVCGLQILFVSTHLPAYCVDQGLGERIGSWSISVIGAANVVGSYTMGHLGGRYPQHKTRLLSLLYASRSVAMLLFISVKATELSVVLFAFATGFLWLGTVPLTQVRTGLGVPAAQSCWHISTSTTTPNFHAFHCCHCGWAVYCR
eukprot:COSAG02_NODE_5692_length_4119_cov_2.601244_1_plen_387_part_00